MQSFKRFCVIDDFLLPNKAELLAKEFLAWEDPRWIRYDNPVEEKLACNDWNAFGPNMYRFFSEVNSYTMLRLLGSHMNGVYSDPGLHGGGMHMHGPGGNLNPHLDYEVHPKLGLRRKLNLIVYLSDLSDEVGGKLGFWEDRGELPGMLKAEVPIKFNSAVLFETERCWHGMSTPMAYIIPPVYRKSLAAYYLRDAGNGEGLRRARFVARQRQVIDPKFLKERSEWNF